MIKAKDCDSINSDEDESTVDLQSLVLVSEQNCKLTIGKRPVENYFQGPKTVNRFDTIDSFI